MFLVVLGEVIVIVFIFGIIGAITSIKKMEYYFKYLEEDKK